jgi:hypothetical protein
MNLEALAEATVEHVLPVPAQDSARQQRHLQQQR